MHKTIEPAILYFGTPVVLISSLNEDGSSNLAPMSSVFWLGNRGILGLVAVSQTTQNLIRTRECELNLPSMHEVAKVNRLALTTGSNPVPEFKQRKGYRYVADNFAQAQLTIMESETIKTPSVKECPIHLEARVVAIHPLAANGATAKASMTNIEVEIHRVRVDESLLVNDHPNRIDPNKWRPLIMSFQRFYGLGEELHQSTLATIPEEAYRPREKHGL